jgi:hypothetical protein
MGTADTSPVDQPRIAAAALEILAAIGEDPQRDGLLTSYVRGLFRNELSSPMEAMRTIGIT